MESEEDEAFLSFAVQLNVDLNTQLLLLAGTAC